MSQIQIVTGLNEQDIGPSAYRIAEHILVSDARVPLLRPFALNQPGRRLAPVNWLHVQAGSLDSLVYSGRGWIANAWRQVECVRAPEGYQLRILGLCTFWISEDGHLVAMIKQEGSQPKELLMQAAVGAPFLLALALQHVYSLHVSLVQLGDRWLAFAGESGEGKSTLARFLGFESGHTWRRVADDILPVRLRPSGEIEALAHFPQLKLPDGEQPVYVAPPRVPLSVLYVLDKGPQAQSGSVRIRPLRRRRATLALVQHTIAARLFDRQLLADHLAFCDHFSAAVPVRSLTYPRRFDDLPLVRAALEEDLAIAV